MIDGGVEVGTGWTFNSYGMQDAAAARTGSYGGSVTRNLSPASPGIAVSPPTAVSQVIGGTYTLRAWFKWASGGDTQECAVQILDSERFIAAFYLNKDAGTIERTLPTPNLITGGYNFTNYQGLSHTWTAIGSTPIRVDVRNRIKNPSVTATWYFDDISIETDDMAVKLAERGVGAIQTLLAADLETELAAIDTDRSDSITTAGTTTAYYTYPRAVIGGGETHIEIFEDAFDVGTRYQDTGAIYDLPLTVRVTFFNRNQDTEGNFVTRARWLATGVFNVFAKKPRLAGADAAVQFVQTNSIEPHWESESEDSTEITKAVTTLHLMVKCEEVQ